MIELVGVQILLYGEIRELIFTFHYKKVRRRRPRKRGSLVLLRAGNLSPARWVSPTNPKLGPGRALIFLARKTGLNLARPDWPAGPNSIGSGWPGFFSGWPGLKN